MNRLANKRCLIVGGSSGIGRAAAERFQEEGAALLLAGLPAEHGESIQLPKGKAPFVGCDAAQEAEVDALLEQAGKLLGGLDVLYHVAGMSGRQLGDGPLHQCTAAGWQATLDANLKSVFLTNRAAARHFLEKNQPGAILNLASVLAFAPAPAHFDTAAYTAAKGGIIALSRLAAARYAADGIRVNVIAPSLIDTPMASRAVGDPAIRKFLKTKQPLAGGPGKPEDCSDAAVFLASDEARFITGIVLPVDGGWCVSDGQL